MKDLAYFVGSCFLDAEAEKREAEVLDFYFDELRVHSTQAQKVEDDGVHSIEWPGRTSTGS